ncbi:hypothetical protein M422DRAFT_27812 [Sphaerobolus stellatus SS14]|nr:hypothetical protein M422DRAFT_27812 [Sphaerobolus stellatus SS14]
MSSIAVLRTPPAPTSSSRRNDYLSLRPSRGTGRDSRQHIPAPVSILPKQKSQTSREYSFAGSPTPVSPSPLRRRNLFQQDPTDYSDSDDDEQSPSLNRLPSSPFNSHCATPFLGGWATRAPKMAVSNQPIEDDEGLFLVNNTTAAVSKTPFQNNTSARSETVSRLTSTPAPKKRPSFITLSPLPPSRPRIPQTPAETEWHLGRQTESMVKLSLGDPDASRQSKFKQRSAASLKDPESSPLHNRGQKRSLDGNELPRGTGNIFETVAETPVVPSFQIPDTPPSAQKVACSPSLFFGPSVHPSPTVPIKGRHLAVPPLEAAETIRSRSVSPKSSSERIAKKYKPRDSGIAGMDKDEDSTVVFNSVNFVAQEDETDLITPSFEPQPRSAWPIPTEPGHGDEFIIKALAAGAHPKEKKSIPDTPVKRNAYTASRPWTSTSKALPSQPVIRGGAPRKSLPLILSNLARLQDSPDDSEASPSERAFPFRKSYGLLGYGRPTTIAARGPAAKGKLQYLRRRSSSGAFSSSSSEGSPFGTPTKLSPPEVLRLPGTQPRPFRPSTRPSLGVLRREPNEHERPGQFERDFVVVEELGSGEFGSAIKVRYKEGNAKEVFAIKKSKRLEGVKHRRRLREEIDVLQHLKHKSGDRGHPNILTYIDSWEQDDTLFIQTELCELGDYATFLTEYGAHFEALDEARVWKVCAELSNGLKFIHDSGVIHLDLKPANIFITSQGRFRIGDFGMASLWPRQTREDGFEREGDRDYMAPEVLRGCYGPAADMFGLGMIILETATNIVVPNQGDDWHRLREDDFSAVDFIATGGVPRSSELVSLIMEMMRADPERRLTISQVYHNPILTRAREDMARKLSKAMADSTPLFVASPLGGEPDSYVSEVLQVNPSNYFMDLSP